MHARRIRIKPSILQQHKDYIHSQHTQQQQQQQQTMAGPMTGQQVGRAVRWWTRVRDVPELTVLGGLVGGVLVLATYTIKKTLLNNESGSYPSIVMRGDPWKQVETGRMGLEDASTGKRSWLWHVAQYKMDKDGANIGILFDNRARPQQYSKPGAGYAGGLATMQTL